MRTCEPLILNMEAYPRKRRQIMHQKLAFWITLVFLVVSSAWAQPSQPPEAHRPGPYIIPVDYDSLLKMKKPPEYKPFEVYGMFLMSVAAQQTPLVMNPFMKVPDKVIQTNDDIFKKANLVEM